MLAELSQPDEDCFRVVFCACDRRPGLAVASAHFHLCCWVVQRDRLQLIFKPRAARRGFKRTLVGSK
ncbi:hypothetical protein EYF80_013508 [Liparis tanakae]|uniref:Uncharacterized protein n=1 Tax=Liparis tanakae TaxID=230148 RepID=A0A4Z2IEB3_9TELE|nr:hypothetical protein EYF80_013508 [Liparis tanakae]